MGAESVNSEELVISGEGVEQVQTEFLGERHTAVKRSDGRSYVDGDVSLEFRLTIQDTNRNAVDQIVLTYDTIECIYAEYEAV